ncbi:MAG TPA: long-chain fatty acid--CoA ligase [Chitinophagales bacterium]
MQATRLFDVLSDFQNSPKPDLFIAKENGAWRNYSSTEVFDLIQQLAAGLLAKGISANDFTVEKRDKIAILSNSRPEWLITDLAVQSTGAVLVPLYPNTSPNEVEKIFLESEVKFCFVNDKITYDVIKSVQPKVPSLQEIFVFEEVSGATNWKTILKPVGETEKAQLTQIADRTKTEDVATIIYTSGTTGNPKGVMLTHKNIMSNLHGVEPIIESVIHTIPVAERRALSFLPLNHILEKMVTYVYLYHGISIGYAENISTIAENLKELQPNVFVSVPRLLEKVYEKIMSTGNTLTGFKKWMFFKSLEVAEKFELNTTQPLFYRLQLAFFRKLVFTKWHEALGGKVLGIVVGGAPMQVKLIRIFTAAGIPVIEGYGLTETSPVIAVNGYIEKDRKFGTVGRIIKSVEVKIAEDGEILTKSDSVMLGYYKQPALTAEAVHDGWFATGDIGEITADSFLRITDRKKEIFKNSGGKYVAPQPIENTLKGNPLIEQVIILGPDRKFTSALIVPGFDSLKEWCNRNGLQITTREEIITNPKVVAEYKKIVDGFNPQFNHVEQVKKFTLIADEWSVETGELTPKMSMKRKFIMEKYLKQIDAMYA